MFRSNEVSYGGMGIAVFGSAHDNEFIGNELHHNAKGAHTDCWAGSGNVFTDNVTTTTPTVASGTTAPTC